MSIPIDLNPLILLAAVSGGLGIYAAALALGIRHGIDWDHIAAITDITSTTASVDETRESWLMGEPGVSLTDESHHFRHGPHDHAEQAVAATVAMPAAEAGGRSTVATIAPASTSVELRPSARAGSWVLRHRAALALGSLYALGHGFVVVVLGVIAITAREFLPAWLDPIMERVVGVTLILLSVYLFYSVYSYFRGGQFRLRSRWMLVFAGVRNAWHWIRSRTGQHEHLPQEAVAYGPRTAWSIGMIHGIGAETGTQALIIATAVGASSKAAAVGALLVFVLGLLISNSFVTVASTAGFVSAKKRQVIYVAAGLLAAVFSLVVGIAFLGAFADALPGLEPYFRWIGGPDTE